MKIRIVTGLVAFALLVGVLLLPPVALYGVFSVICALAIYEMFTVTGLKTHRELLIAAMAFGAVAPFFNQTFGYWLWTVATAVWVLLLMVVSLRKMDTLSIQDVGLACFLTLLLSIGLSCIVYCRTFNEYGMFYLMLALIIAWGSDIGAYFTGTLCGRHKLCPRISPKKTVEGFIGGWVSSVLLCLAWVFIWNRCCPAGLAPVNYWQVALVAFVLSPLSVLGDLFASLIKRQNDTKDYGNIMPGHGGVMDRFDSLMLVGPFLYAILHMTTLV